VYSSGLLAGALEEQPFAGTSFANHYENSSGRRSKFLLTQYAPAAVANLSCCDHHFPKTTMVRSAQYNAFHNTLKLLYYGLLPVLPGKPTTPLYW